MGYNIKDQLKNIFSNASRHVPTKNEDVIQTEDTFITEDFSQITIQYEKSPDKVIVEQDYNTLRTDIQERYEKSMALTTTKGITDTITKSMHTDNTNNLLEWEHRKIT